MSDKNTAGQNVPLDSLVGIASLHPKAFGLTRQQHQSVVGYARSYFAEAWISKKFVISRCAVREICATEGVVPARNELIDGKWKSFDMQDNSNT